jgi:phospholipid/cholesterol/gamma-HCH transport system substrate-binding protein
MDSKIRYRVVGGFLLAGFLLLVSILVWLMGGTGLESVDRYLVYFEKQSLDGLQKDSLVSMRGIRVGVVEHYVISSNDIEKVKVLLKLDHGVPVKTDTRAVIRRNFLTGLANIDLIGGTQTSEPLLITNDDLPVIPEEVTQLDKIADSVPDLLEKFDTIASRLTLLFSNENINTIEGTLQSLNEISSQLSVATPTMVKTFENLEKVTSRAADAVAKVSGNENSTGVVDEVVLITDEIKEIVTEVKEATVLIAPMVRKLSRSSDRIQREILNIGRGVSEVSEAYSDPKSLLSGDTGKK